MSESEVVEKVSELMRALDEVRGYRELAYAMIDFVAIMVVTVIASILIIFFQRLYDVINGPRFPLIGASIPFVVLAGFVVGAFWVDRKVKRTKTGEWEKTMKEGVPGALKLLSELDWESQLGMVSTSRIAYLFYAVLKIVGYSLLTYILLELFGGFLGLWYWIPSGQYIPGPISVIIVLIFSKKNLEVGFNQLRSMDLLFWDLRWFYSEFKRAEFNKA